ncbi:unnamed protein product [[Candida] boidinii]|nr:unnamed protein product [[Candida] boidinii]
MIQTLQTGNETANDDNINHTNTNNTNNTTIPIKDGEEQEHPLGQRIYRSPSDKLLVSPISAKLSNPHRHLTKFLSVNDAKKPNQLNKLDITQVNLTSKLKALDLR